MGPLVPEMCVAGRPLPGDFHSSVMILLQIV